MSQHIVSPRIYAAIFATLMLCTVLTVYAATLDLNRYFPALNIIAALVIATFKASLVVLFFMHARYSPQRTQLVIVCSAFWLAIMLALTLADYRTRSSREVPPPSPTVLHHA